MAEAPRIRTLAAAEAGALADLGAGSVHGLRLPGLLSPAEAAAACAAAATLPARVTPPFPGTTHGSVLIVTPDRETYLADAARLRLALAGLYDRVLDALSTLAGAPVGVPTLGDRPCAALTVRVLPPGAEVAVHSERWAWPAMDWHRAHLDPRQHLSFYIPLNPLPEGGALELFHRPNQPEALDGLAPAAARARLAAHGLTAIAPEVGELLIFDGGRFNHRVCPAPVERWTLGGFAGRDRAGRLWVWS